MMARLAAFVEWVAARPPELTDSGGLRPADTGGAPAAVRSPRPRSRDAESQPGGLAGWGRRSAKRWPATSRRCSRNSQTSGLPSAGLACCSSRRSASGRYTVCCRRRAPTPPASSEGPMRTLQSSSSTGAHSMSTDPVSGRVSTRGSRHTARSRQSRPWPTPAVPISGFAPCSCWCSSSSGRMPPRPSPNCRAMPPSARMRPFGWPTTTPARPLP